MTKKNTTETTETPAPPAEKRKRRTALEMFAAQKQEHADNIARLEVKIKETQAELEQARDAQIEFIESAKKALGL